MRRWLALSVTVGLFAWSACAPVFAQSPPPASPAALVDQPADPAQWQKDLAAWRAQHEHELAAPDGWLTLIGLEWLKAGANPFGSAAENKIALPSPAPAHLGILEVSGKTVRLAAPAGGFPAEFKIDGSPASEGELNTDGRKPSILVWRSLTMLVIERGGNFALRIKDADSPERTAFKGLNWYAPDPRFRIVAQWVPYTPPRNEQVPTEIRTILNLPAPGIARFTLDGRELGLEPLLMDPNARRLFFVLRDTTSKTTTYQASRFLYTGLPSNGLDRPGTLVLDFNHLENPPCAYTPYATCPLPIEQNRLPVALEAGEKRYAH